MQRKSWRQFDPWLIILALALVAYGLVVIRSATLLADRPVSNQLLTQGAYAVLGLAVMGAVSLVDYRLLGALAAVAYTGVLALLALVLVVGRHGYGAQRWIGVGFATFQPSELAKVVVILFLARYLAGGERRARSLKTLLGSAAIVGVPFALVYRQPDLGTALVLAATWFGMTFAAGAPLKWLGAALAVPLVGFPVLWRVMHEYMRQRLLLFVRPDLDPQGDGYNIIQARISVGAGGLWGRGLGNGTQTQLNFLRVQHTDFIFAVLGEELGFAGAVALLALFGTLFWRCLRVASHSRDTFGKLLATGVTTMLLFQVFVNIGMNVGLVPVAGIPLPFISFGGSSLVSTFLCLGLLQSVLLHSQARRYDTKPDVVVPARLRLEQAWSPPAWAGPRPAGALAPHAAPRARSLAPHQARGDRALGLPSRASPAEGRSWEDVASSGFPGGRERGGRR